MFKLQVTIFFTVFCILLPSSTYATMVKVKNKTQKHFDINKDKYLNRYEYSLYKTHLHFGYPLAKKKKQKPYDFNGDLMLEPFELQSYLLDKKRGKLKKYVKEDSDTKVKVKVNLTPIRY